MAIGKDLIVTHSQSFTLAHFGTYTVDTIVDSEFYDVLSIHAVIKVYNILMPVNDIEVIVEVFEVQDNYVLSYPFSSEIWQYL